MIGRFFAAVVAAIMLCSTLAIAADPIQVRFGRHPGFERMVFDWSTTVPYRVEQEDKTVTVTFDSAAQVDVAALRKGLSRVAGNAGAVVRGDKLVVTFTLKQDVTIADSRSGAKVVLDFQSAAAQKALPAIAPAAGEAEPDTAAEAPAGAVGPPRSLLPSGKPAAAPATTRQKLVGPPTPRPEPPPAPAAAAPRVEPPPPPPAAAAPPISRPPEPPAAAAAAAPPPPAASPEPPAAEPPPVASVPPEATPAPAPAPKEAAESAPPQRRAAPQPPPAPPAPPPVVPVEFARTLDGQGLRFNWTEPVGAAVFSRGETLWIVFDRPAQLDLSRTDARRAELTGEIEVITNEATVVRLAPPGGAAAIARREGTAWLVELGGSSRAATMALPANPVRVTARRGTTQADSALVVEMDGSRSVFRLTDPDAGDTIIVVPSNLSGAGVTDARYQPEVRLLRSAQGVAVLPLADGVNVHPLGTRVEITALRGISISPADAPGPAPAVARPSRGGQRLFDFAQWRRGGPSRLSDERWTLQNEIANAPPATRNARRLELARLLFANGLALDALGHLQLIQQDDPDLGAVVPIKALRAASALMAGDIETAREINDLALDGDPEASFWRGALAVAEGDPKRGAAAFGGIADYSIEYPAPYANRLALMLAEARIAVGDFASAQNRLALMSPANASVGELAEADYLRGKALAGMGRGDEAITLWKAVEDRGYAPARVSAVLARVDAELARKTVTPQQAVESLDRLRFTWRGDRREFAVLGRLGKLQIEIGDIRAGLQTLRQAVTYYPDQRDTQDLVAAMTAGFERFFLSAETLKRVPIVAVGIFDEFRELTPPGARGDAVMNRMVDHLMAMDLLDRAGDLLDHLVKHRFAKAEKAAAGAKLALVRLLDRNPAAALEAIDASAAPEADADTQAERARLAARALSDLDKPAEALQRIADDKSGPADVLRAEINWRAQNWAPAAAALGRLVGDPPAAKTDMAEEQARRVVRLATALALAGDDAGLQGLRERFGPAIDRGPYKSVFATITATKGQAPTEMADLAARIAEATPIQSFLKDYRAKLAAPKPKG